MKLLCTLSILILIIGNNVMADIQPGSKPILKKTKLLFIHHSVGGYWLAHDYGGLTSALNKNGYYVNDVSYGWEPEGLHNSLFKKLKRKVLKILGKTDEGAFGIGNRTDIGNMPDWFIGKDSEYIMDTLYNVNLETEQYGQSSNSTSEYPLQNPDPETENQIIMFKSCYPNTLLKGSISDPPSTELTPPRNFTPDSDFHTVANAKRIFNDLLPYFSRNSDKFFVIITPPPQYELPEQGRIARGFANWLVHFWLKENNYKQKNVMVFDLYNVLTSKGEKGKNDVNIEEGNHHRIWNGEVQHIVGTENHLLSYPKKIGDDHPSHEGLRKATIEFVPLLNYYYNDWMENI